MSILNLYAPSEEFSSDLSNMYSTEETRIGTWIDGKPLYRQIVEIKNMRASATDITPVNIDLSEAFDVTRLDGMVVCTAKSGVVSLVPLSKTANIEVQLLDQQESGLSLTYINTDTTGSLWDMTLVIEYTKNISTSR